MGWGKGTGVQKALLYQFFFCNFYKPSNYPQNFLIFSFNPFATVLQILKAIPNGSPKLLSLNQDHPLKKVFLLVKSL